MKKHFRCTIFLQIAAISAFAQTTLTLQPDAAAGKDAEIFSCVPCGYDTRNFGTKQDLNAVAWTNNGDFGKIRSLIQFDLSSIPAGTIITDARLSLFYNTGNGEGTDVSSFAHPNKSLLQRITSSWVESTVTWINQPAVSTLHQVVLPHSTSSTQNYPDINVTALVQDMVNNPATSFGFRLRLKKEVKFNKLLFASSDNPTASLRPKLVVTYTTLMAATENPTEAFSSLRIPQKAGTDFQLVPNPAKDEMELFIPSEENDATQIKAYNLIGKEVYNQKVQLTKGNNSFLLKAGAWGKGIYLFVVKTSKIASTKKLILE